MIELTKEYEDIIDEVCKKYGYDDKDEEGKDSLKTVLLKLVPCMLDGVDDDKKELFFEMLRTTPIVILDVNDERTTDDLDKIYIGDSHPTIQQEEIDEGEYSNKTPDGAYVSDFVMDENLNLAGKKSYIFIKKAETSMERRYFETDINVSHLVHELGHAWNAQKDQYTIDENGNLVSRVGTSKRKYKIEQDDTGKYIAKGVSVEGLFIEEEMNSIEEERAMAKYKGISVEQVKQDYRSELVPSTYQSVNLIGFTEDLLQVIGEDDIKKWRMFGDNKYLDKINELLSQTDHWKRRNEIFADNSTDEMSYTSKKKIFAETSDSQAIEFLQDNKDIFFADISAMTPIGRLDNVMEQMYTFDAVKYRYDIFDPKQKKEFQDILIAIMKEGYKIVNQARQIKEEEKENSPMEQIKDAIQDVTASRVDKVTKETKQLIKQNEITKEETVQGDNANGER